MLVEFAWPLAKDEYSIESKEGRLADKVALLDPGLIEEHDLELFDDLLEADEIRFALLEDLEEHFVSLLSVEVLKPHIVCQTRYPLNYFLGWIFQLPY